MEDDLKYFIPEISDLHIGYEYEQALIDCNWSITGWGKRIVTESSDLKLIKEYPSLHRTPFLTKEQIEAEGWKLYSKGKDLWFKKEILIENFDWSGLNNLYGYKPYKLFLNYGLHDHKIHIKCDFSGGQDFTESDTLFEGYCPSINELRMICKLLKIN